MTFGTTAVQQNDKGVLVWVGSGDAANFHSLIPESYSQCLLIEADEMQTEPLLQLQQRDEKVRSLIKAVATEDGPSLFYRYNLDQFNALQPATGLLQLYPGLKLQEQVTLQAISISTLIREQQLEPTFKHTLVLSVPAQAYGLLRSLAEQDLLTLFYQLNVQVGQTELYQDAGTCSELEFWLQQQGYLLCETDKSDPDLWLVVFRRHPLLDKLRKLETVNDDLTSQLEMSIEEQRVLSQRLQQHSSEIEELTHRQNAELVRIKQDNVELAVRVTEADSETGKIRNQLRVMEVKLQAARVGNAELHHKLQQAESTATEAHSSLLSKNELLVEQLQALEIQLHLVREENIKLQQAEGIANNSLNSALNDLELLKKQLVAIGAELQSLREENINLLNTGLAASENLNNAEMVIGQLQQQQMSLATQLQVVTATNAELLARAESQAQQTIQSETAALAKQHTLEQKLQHAEQILLAEREAAEVVTAQLRVQLQTEEQELRNVVANNAELVAKGESLLNQIIHIEARAIDLQHLLDTTTTNLTNMTNQATYRLDAITQLEKSNRRLLEENQQLSERQHALQQEMLKAEAQIDLIKELILKE
ncbi:hypothetical protein [Rheinheimera tilapiae]|uniref:Uncharacterized protein n=1 Tax=Rheinheimera tilapiae TaxID=875043 RepID=A0ABV6B8M7_9GAMM